MWSYKFKNVGLVKKKSVQTSMISHFFPSTTTVRFPGWYCNFREYRAYQLMRSLSHVFGLAKICLQKWQKIFSHCIASWHKEMSKHSNSSFCQVTASIFKTTIQRSRRKCFESVQQNSDELFCSNRRQYTAYYSLQQNLLKQ